MSDNKHEPDEARENKTGPEDVQESTRGVDTPDITEVIDTPVPGGESAGEATAEPSARAVPETEKIQIGQDAGAAVPDDRGNDAGPDDAATASLAPAGGTQPVPAEIPPHQDPYAGPGVPGPAAGQGAQPATAVQTARQPNAAAQPAPQQGPRVGTVVWGLVVLAIGLGVLAAAAGARIDVSLAAILLLGGAGIALVAGSIVSSFRRRGEP